MRGLAVGVSPAFYEIVPEPVQSGASSYSVEYEIPQDEPSQPTLNGSVDGYDAGLVTPTISEFDGSTKTELDTATDTAIKDIYSFIDEEQRIDKLFAEIVDGVTLNPEGHIVNEPVSEQVARELRLPAIQTDAEVVSHIDELTENVMSIHNSIDATPISETQINQTLWEPAFNYSPEPESVLPQDDYRQADDEKPFINPDGIVSRSLRRLRIIGPEPIKKEIVRPDFINAELNVDEKITDQSVEKQSSSTAWLDELDTPEYIDSENIPTESFEQANASSEATDFLEETFENNHIYPSEIRPTTTIREEDTQAASLKEDEVAVLELIMHKTYQTTEEEPEKTPENFVAVPQVNHDVPLVHHIETTEAEDSKNNSKPALTDVVEQQTTTEIVSEVIPEDQKIAKAKALKNIYLGEAHPWEVAQVATAEKVKPAQLYAFLQYVFAEYNEKYSIETVWKLYADGRIKVDGTIMDSDQQHELNTMLINSMEKEFALAA